MTSRVNPQDAFDMGMEMYVSLYPLVTMDITRRVMTSVRPNQVPGMGPMGAPTLTRSIPQPG